MRGLKTNRVKRIFKLLIIFGLLLMSSISTALAQEKNNCQSPPDDKQLATIPCPDFIEKNNFCIAYRRMYWATLQYIKIMKAPPEIQDVSFKDETLYVTIRRGSAIVFFELGKFRHIKSMQFHKNSGLVEIEYKTKSKSEKIKDIAIPGGAGFITGVLTVLGILLLF